MTTAVKETSRSQAWNYHVQLRRSVKQSIRPPWSKVVRYYGNTKVEREREAER